ncbi:protein of unknown function [Taphrina deformans PYCC 5710]|uniref:Uncharacterized protein n=1 Tax=Taphrina deformans (strain PYCC 5710 / ATCC 11124 / CBS 356.35 / IMI 108563 / JCM 9778 / NBRC 8474) TaxID=1097556 RepID=R4XDM4_TAPDE|nr:protein of unknown function [Taphrina deformans PYCC 5710]|eukprot:CCG83976.1 protein of unknown function [Taphrina deformans PYCC 5710]
MVLFMTRFEGPVVFFFHDSVALRVVLVMMQTKFIEVLHSAVAENAIGVYAIQVLKFCEDQYVENATTRKQEFVDTELRIPKKTIGVRTTRMVT